MIAISRFSGYNTPVAPVREPSSQIIRKVGYSMSVLTITQENFNQEVLSSPFPYSWTSGPPGAAPAA